MRHVHVFVLASLIACPALAQKNRPEEIQRQRQEIIASLLTTEQQQTISQKRWTCMHGNEPSSVKDARVMGFDYTPDASDGCVAVLQRSAKDRRLGTAYTKLLSETGGSAELSEKLPKAIGNAVLSGNGDVSIGNGKAMTVTGAIALDAGFTVAYMEGAAKKPSPDAQKMKAVTETCLANATDAATCFSVGYVYGAQAFNAR